jgi:glycosyltransferase involved in cell wall biosynthesis
MRDGGRTIPRNGARVAPQPHREIDLPDRVRVGFVSRTLSLGGAEVLLSQMMEFCDPAKIEWAFLGIYDNDITAQVMRDKVLQYCPIVLRPDLRQACEDCDVVITWGTPLDDDIVPPRPRRAKVVLMALGMDEFTRYIMTSSPAADSLVAVSRVAIDTIPQDERHKVTSIPTGVDLRRIVPRISVAEMRRQWELRVDQKALVFLGRVAPEKNPIAVARLIGALNRMGHPDWRGILVGPKGMAKFNILGYAPDTEGLSEEIAPGLIRFAGPTDDVGSVLAAADHLILPSFIEGNSIALLEMWAAGKPVLATPVGFVAHEHPDLVRPIQPYAMGSELAQALVADLDDAQGTAERVRRAKEITLANYTWEAIGKRWTDHIVSLAGSS